MITIREKIRRCLICAALLFVCACLFVQASSAYWVWTPETKKFINPKYAVKDTPKEQFDWAMSFYDAKDYTRASVEFEKLAKQYEFSEYASKAQYYAGLCYENMGKYYIAFQNYQKAVDNFPHIENMDEIIAREFNIANIYSEKENPKVLGTDIMTSTDRAVEVYTKVVDNAPFGKLADEAQFKMGELLKRVGRYEEATIAFQKIVDEYPDSQWASKAQYEVAYCAYRASLQPAYDAGPTDRAIQIFKEFTVSTEDRQLSEEAAKTMQRLKDKAAEKSMMTAKFYERQGHPKSAIIYYQDVLDRYPDSIHAVEAQAKIEELKARKDTPGGIFGWVARMRPSLQPEKTPAEAEQEKAAMVSKKKRRGLFGWFGEKEAEAPKPGEKDAKFESVADQVAHQAAMQAVTAGGIAGSGVTMTAVPGLAGMGMPIPAAPTAAPVSAAPNLAGVDASAVSAMQTTMPAGPAAEPAGQPFPAPVLIQEPWSPMAYEDVGMYEPAARDDDPNVEIQDDDRM